MALVTGKGLTAFAQGMYDGYSNGKKRELENKRAEMEIERLKREEEMLKERNAVGEVKPTKAFSLVTPDGVETIYTDEKEASEAAQALSGLGEGQTFQVQPRYLVNGRRFNDEEAANKLAQAESTPAAQLRRKAQIASRYGFNDVAASDLKTYKDLTNAIKYEKVDALMQAQVNGDLDTLTQLYSAQTGQQVRLERNDDGTITPVSIRGDQEVKGKPVSPDQLWNYAIEAANRSPDNWNEDRNYRLQVDKFKHQQGQDTIANQQRAAGLGMQAAGLGLRQQEMDFNRSVRANPPPTTQMAYDANGNLVPVTRSQSFNAGSGQWDTTVLPGAALPGVYGSDPTRRPADPNEILKAIAKQKESPPTVFVGLDENDAKGLVEMDKSRATPNQGGAVPLPGGGMRLPDGSVRGTVTR